MVQPIMEEGLQILREVGNVEVFRSDRRITREELIAGVKECDYVVTLGAVRITAEVMDSSPKLKGVSIIAMGPDAVDVEAATARGIAVTTVDHVIAKTTADLTMALVVGVAWRLVEADRFTRAGKFKQEHSMSFMCDSLSGKVLGMIGLGAIGEEVAKRARAFEMLVIYNKRSRLPDATESQLSVEWCQDKDEVLRRADFVVIMASYNESTHILIGAREFALMKPGVFFINTARGRIVDEGALIEALRSGHVKRAGLDVYWAEPPISEPNPNPQLLAMDNVILTPHIGSATWESRAEMATLAAQNLVAMVKGELPRNLCNPEIYRPKSEV